jgi:hypothetical protein
VVLFCLDRSYQPHSTIMSSEQGIIFRISAQSRYIFAGFLDDFVFGGHHDSA